MGLNQVYGFIKRNNGAVKVYPEPEVELNLFFTFHVTRKQISKTPHLKKQKYIHLWA
jgi:hypothetical protein